MSRSRTIILSALVVAGLCDAPGAGAPRKETMKAVRISRFGGPEVLAIEAVPRPSPAPGEVLVRVHAAGVNPVDWKIRSGMLEGFGPRPPLILGVDVSGVVEAVGEGVKERKVGDEVFAYLSIRRCGGYAEFVAVPEKDLATKPKAIAHVHAAAVPLAGLTAWQALVDAAELSAGQTVLIHGGAGGVGHMAVQIAKARGATVIATASVGNHDFLKEIGADRVIDYRAQKFEEQVKGVDVVLDTIGGETLARSYQVVRPGGIIVSVLDQPDPAVLKERGIRGRMVFTSPNGNQLTEIAALIDEGKVKPHVSETIPLSEVAKAHEKSESGRTRGKIVLIVLEH